ncbi:MAG: cupin [SAR86 cluster bacterium]|uniref:Cupin n=1 Tax=SAR86 cluster bacterium TaxID=2030880 RepID=A0A2A4MX95_9GAMM|nr:MAG: cupin [SAR86 cluster bacterium]
MQCTNIFNNIPADLTAEVFETIVHSDAIKIERISSKGHSSTALDWYDQSTHEWVILLKGSATIRFDDMDEVQLIPGSYLNIPAHTRHAVTWTDPDQHCIWLAVHY